VDDLTRSFAVEAALRQIDDCSSITELKALTKTLIKSHFEARSFIATLLLQVPTPSYQAELDDELPWRRG
jgi:hypothetical protein